MSAITKSLLYIMCSAPLIMAAGAFAGFKIYNETVVYDYEINRGVQLKVLEPKKVVTENGKAEYTLSFLNIDENAVLSKKIELIDAEVFKCYDFYKDRVGETVTIKEEKGIATSFFGTHDFDRTIKSSTLLFKVCEYSWLKELEERAKR